MGTMGKWYSDDEDLSDVKRSRKKGPVNEVGRGGDGIRYVWPKRAKTDTEHDGPVYPVTTRQGEFDHGAQRKKMPVQSPLTKIAGGASSEPGNGPKPLS